MKAGNFSGKTAPRIDAAWHGSCSLSLSLSLSLSNIILTVIFLKKNLPVYGVMPKAELQDNPAKPDCPLTVIFLKKNLPICGVLPLAKLQDNPAKPDCPLTAIFFLCNPFQKKLLFSLFKEDHYENV
ncbi:MAG: hypothetical protein LBI67_03850 [Treponema sp.]|jgi:hypothetical protein|nr:hypothetical protein [Treponema sp.]